jgi:hypothetical protein
MKRSVSKKANLLLIRFSNKKVKIQYNSNPYTWKLPLIGLRPPFYCNPRYEHYYPIL